MDHVDASHTCDLVHDHRPQMPTRLRGLFIALGAAVEMKPVLHDVLRESQILVLVPELTTETRNMIGANELATLPKDAIVINTGRGQVVDFLALSDALQNGHLFAAGIDAFYPEPLPSGHPLLTNPRVTFSPHIAGTTIEASLQFARSAADQILTALHGELPAFPVNEAAWEGSRARRPKG